MTAFSNGSLLGKMAFSLDKIHPELETTKPQVLRMARCTAGSRRTSALSPVREAPSRHSEAEPHEPVMSKLRTRYLDFTPEHNRILDASRSAQGRRSSGQDNKKPGKTSPALESPSYRGNYPVFSTSSIWHQNKNAGGQPPALEGPPIRSIHLLYTTNQNVNSILPKIEHMFYTNNTNICSPYRKAA